MHRQNEKKPELQSADFVNVPHFYEVLNARDEKQENHAKIRIIATGCDGEHGKPRDDAAKLVDTVAKTSPAPILVINTGDRAYDNGIDSPTDIAFETIVKHKLPQINALGNHDHNLHNGPFGRTEGNVDGYKKANAQIQHTFMKNGVHSPELLTKFRGHTLDIADLQQWNCIGRVCGFLIKGDPTKGIKDIVLFILDSSTYIRESLLARGKERDNPNNQANWFKRIYKQYKNAEKLVFMHHPIYALDKRVLKSDAPVYLNPIEISQYPEGFNHSDMLRQEFQDFIFTLFCAHSHTLAYVYDQSICQVVSGGAGGPLQDRWNYAKTPMYLQRHGIADVWIDPSMHLENKPSVTINFHTTDGQQLQFNNLSGNAVKRLQTEPAAVVCFRKIAVEACNQYFAHLGTLPQKGVGYYFGGPSTDAKERTDDIVNFCNQFEPITDPKKLYDFVIQKLQRWGTPGEKSMVTFLSKLMQHYFKLSYEDFVKYPAQFTEAVQKKMQEQQAAPAATQAINIPKAARTANEGKNSGSGSASSFMIFGSHMLACSSRESSPSLVGIPTPPASPPKA